MDPTGAIGNPFWELAACPAVCSVGARTKFPGPVANANWARGAT